MESVSEKVSALHKGIQILPKSSILKSTMVQEDLKDLQIKYVLVPIEKIGIK